MTSLAKWLNVRLRPEWLWVWIPLQSQTMMLLQKVFHGTYFLEKYSKFFQQIFLRTAAYSCFWNVVLPTLCSPWAHNILPCKIITKFSKVPMSFVKRTEWFFLLKVINIYDIFMATSKTRYWFTCLSLLIFIWKSSIGWASFFFRLDFFFTDIRDSQSITKRERTILIPSNHFHPLTSIGIFVCIPFVHLSCLSLYFQTDWDLSASGK